MTAAALYAPWQLSNRSDWCVSRLADRHYSRQKPGTRQFSPPGMNLTLKIGDGDIAEAGWVWWHPHKNSPVGRYDKYDGYICCSLFRNEDSGYLSSDLIRAAVYGALCLWDFPSMACDLIGFDTYVQPSSIDSPNPGYCYQKAGWHKTDDWTKDRKKRRLVLPLSEAIRD